MPKRRKRTAQSRGRSRSLPNADSTEEAEIQRASSRPEESLCEERRLSFAAHLIQFDHPSCVNMSRIALSVRRGAKESDRNRNCFGKASKAAGVARTLPRSLLRRTDGGRKRKPVAVRKSVAAAAAIPSPPSPSLSQSTGPPGWLRRRNECLVTIGHTNSSHIMTTEGFMTTSLFSAQKYATQPVKS